MPCRGPKYELYSVQVDGYPIVPMDREREPLLTPNRVNHDRSAVLGQFDYAFPQEIAHSRRHMTDEYACTDLK
ncbi:hypothetical protein GCM10009792_25360 [Microcella alkalica]